VGCTCRLHLGLSALVFQLHDRASHQPQACEQELHIRASDQQRKQYDAKGNYGQWIALRKILLQAEHQGQAYRGAQPAPKEHMPVGQRRCSADLWFQSNNHPRAR
jgi:hypothetical protein